MGLFRPSTPAYDRPRTLTASAARVRLNDRASLEMLQARRSSSVWQEEAWEYYDSIGEIKYAFGLVAAVVSRIRLFAAVVVDPESAPVPVADGVRDPIQSPDDVAIGEDSSLIGSRGIDARLARDARQVMNDLLGNSDMSQMLANAAINLQVSGECYLANLGEGWRIYSTSELVVSPDGQITLKSTGSAGSSTRGKPVDPNSPIGRIWRPHPRYSADADSSMRALRVECDELMLLDRMIRTTARSRMAAGILFVPDALSVAARTPIDMDDSDTDTFESELLAAMTQPIGDESDASAVVPMLVRGPADLGDRIKHLSLGRDLPSQLVDRHLMVLDRILSGLDVPKEIVQGLKDVKYANAMVINEGMYKATIEPMALLLVDSFADIVMRPMLRAMGHPKDQVDLVTIWYDPSEVVSKPDPAEAATQGYDRHLLSADAWRRSQGFGDPDAPDEEEIARRISLEKVQVPPEVGQVLLNALLPSLLGQARQDALAQGNLPPELMDALGEGGGAPAPAAPEPPAPEEQPQQPPSPEPQEQ